MGSVSHPRSMQDRCKKTTQWCHLEVPISVVEGIKYYIDKQKDCQWFFNDVNQPISDAQMVSQAQLHVAETRLFDKDYLTWIKCPIANKMWNDFKTYWMEKFGDYNLLHQLTSKEGALGAHAVLQ
eukprot:3811878-Ditylum_brightwellii.AAC.1